jgi:hypothetical protein
MAYAGAKKFQYQQLQYCPQRNVASISKEKMFAATVSKYDPRTGRTIRLQNCIAPPPPPPPPPSDILIDVGSNGITTLSPRIYNGVGTYAVDNGVPVAFSIGETYETIDINVSSNSKVYINSSSINAFELINYPIVSLSISSPIILSLLKINNTNISGVFDVSKIIGLGVLELNDNFITGVSGLNLARFIASVSVINTNITQTAADSIANQINAAGITEGTLTISTQKTGPINITGAIYNTLREKDWTIS